MYMGIRRDIATILRYVAGVIRRLIVLDKLDMQLVGRGMADQQRGPFVATCVFRLRLSWIWRLGSL